MRLDYQIKPDQTERLARYFLYLALLCFTFIIAFTKIHSGDIWWSLAEGQEIATNHSLLNENRFSYTFPKQPWNSAQWLFSFTAYCIHQAAGIPGLIIIKIVVFIVIVAISLKLLKPIIKNDILLILLLLLFILAIHFRIIIRAHLVSILLFTVLTFILVRFREGRIRYLYILPALTLIWSNFHSGLIFGFGLLIIILIEDLFLALIRTRFSFRRYFSNPSARILFPSIVAAGIATLINPQGLRWLRHATSHLNVGDLLTLVEYQPAHALLPTTGPFFVLTAAFLSVTFIRLYKTLRIQPFDLAALIFLYFSLKHNRVIPYFSILAVLSCAYSLNDLRHFFPHRLISIRKKNTITQIIHAAIGSLIILAPLLLVGRLPFLPPASDFGIGINHYRLPVKSVRFLKANPIAGNGFNSLYWGGYLTWELYPTAKVFIDGRLPAYPDRFVKAIPRMQSSSTEFAKVDNSYNFQYIITSDNYFDWSIDENFNTSDWVPVYWDITGVLIYVRNTTTNAQYISDFGYLLYTPGFNSETYSQQKHIPEYLKQLIVELNRHYAWTGSEYDRKWLAVVEMDYARIIVNR